MRCPVVSKLWPAKGATTSDTNIRQCPVSDRVDYDVSFQLDNDTQLLWLLAPRLGLPRCLCRRIAADAAPASYCFIDGRRLFRRSYLHGRCLKMPFCPFAKCCPLFFTILRLHSVVLSVVNYFLNSSISTVIDSCYFLFADRCARTENENRSPVLERRTETAIITVCTRRLAVINETKAACRW